MYSIVLVQPGLVCLCRGSNAGLCVEPWLQSEANAGGFGRGQAQC